MQVSTPVFSRIGPIADSGHPDALKLIRQILLASAALPMAMPPVLMIFLIATVPVCFAGAPPDQSAQEGVEQSAEGQKEGRFLRLTKDGEESPVALEAAIVHCARKDRGGPTVDLVSAVHVAEKSYYDELNRLFATYDAVLFELVAPEGVQIPKGGVRPTGNPVSILQSPKSLIPFI